MIIYLRFCLVEYAFALAIAKVLLAIIRLQLYNSNL